MIRRPCQTTARRIAKPQHLQAMARFKRHRLDRISGEGALSEILCDFRRRFGWLGTAMLPVKALDTLQPVYGLAAFLILVGVVVTGHFQLVLPILIIMLAKIAIDLTFHLWSLGLYTRWTGQREGLALGPALIAAIAELGRTRA